MERASRRPRQLGRSDRVFWPRISAPRARKNAKRDLVRSRKRSDTARGPRDRPDADLGGRCGLAAQRSFASRALAVTFADAPSDWSAAALSAGAFSTATTRVPRTSSVEMPPVFGSPYRTGEG